ncbi:MAG TPA: hypothetical protein VHD90_05645 [Phototrophicaceae bacterium]|nr:hypothetical protein [Phototrophicaceae bacterium]
MTFTLERIIYGAPTLTGDLSILGISDHLTPQDAALWRGITSLKPMDAASFKESRAFGIFAGPADRFVLACAYVSESKPFYEYVILPRDLLVTLAGNLNPLLTLFDKPVVDAQARVAPVKLNNTERWSPQQRRAQVDALLAHGIDMPQALRLLGAALHERGLMIHDFPVDTNARVAVIKGLLALLPAHARPDLTFSTNRHEKMTTQARIVFGPSSVVTGRWIANWQTHSFPDDEIMLSPFVRRLLALWKGDINAFLNAIDQMDSIAATLVSNHNLQSSLTVMAERHALDAQILAGEEVAPEAIKAVMKDIPPDGDLKRLYVRRLLQHALDARDADAALIVARAMDDDPQIDHMINHELERLLIIHPDEVYSFVRARLGAGSVSSADLDERWLERLKVAALASLRVAILDGDAETAINWLRLVAREPASYDLGQIVRYGILSAQERARKEPALAQALITLAARRDQAALDTLLADPDLLAAVPNALGIALRTGEGDPTSLLQNYGVEVFLMLLEREFESPVSGLFTPTAIDQVWALYTSGTANGSTYSAERIVSELSTRYAARLPFDAQEALLGLMLRDKRDDLSHQVIHLISQAHRESSHTEFLDVITGAISQSERSESESLALIAQMVAVGDLTQEDALNIYIGLLMAWNWRDSALEVMEQVARTIQQHPNIEVRPEIVWQLLTVAAEMKEDFIARVALRRMTADLEKLEDEEVLVEDLQRMNGLIAWNGAAHSQFLNWWRGFIRDQSTARLQRIDKALTDGGETRRSLEDLRNVVQAVIGFRRMLGKRSLTQFAEDVATAYAILQGLAESFDPSPKRPFSFDPATIRQEMEARSSELSPHELKILASNFKELAQLISTMADNRSKATLIRRSDDVDRQLMTGEQQPHSAVDTLKWLAGYLSGTQEKPDENEE